MHNSHLTKAWLSSISETRQHTNILRHTKKSTKGPNQT